MSIVETKPTWSLAPKAAQILGGVPPKQVAKLAQMGLITTMRLPGCGTRYLVADVEKLAGKFTASADSVIPETHAGRSGPRRETQPLDAGAALSAAS